jgi:hypothetical protein
MRRLFADMFGRRELIAPMVLLGGVLTVANEKRGEAQVSNNDQEFKPGDRVPISGIYDVIHDKLDGENHALPHRVTAIAGKAFPPCRACQGWVRFHLHQAVEPVEAHDYFKD